MKIFEGSAKTQCILVVRNAALTKLRCLLFSIQVQASKLPHNLVWSFVFQRRDSQTHFRDRHGVLRARRVGAAQVLVDRQGLVFGG